MNARRNFRRHPRPRKRLPKRLPPTKQLATTTLATADLAADPEIPYAFIVQLLDLTRAYRVNADLTGWFEDDAVFQEAALREDAPFFPHVAFVANE